MESQKNCGANIAGKYKEIRLTSEDASIIRNALSIYKKKLNELYKNADSKASKNKYHKNMLVIDNLRERIDKKYDKGEGSN